MTFTLAELEKRLQERFDRECKEETSQSRNYLAEKQGCDVSEIILPDDFVDNLYIIENGGNRLIGPYWAKRVDEEFIVLRTGRRFSVDGLSEIILEGIDEEGDEWLDDDLDDFKHHYARISRTKLKSENKTTSSLFPNCRIIPYNPELQKMMLWGEEGNNFDRVNTHLHKYFDKDERLRKVGKYLHKGFVAALVLTLVWIIPKVFFHAW